MQVFSVWRQLSRRPLVLGLLIGWMWLVAAPAYAHHPLGGESPSSAFEGMVSGVGHPVIGADHLVFVIAMGLLAAISQRGFVILMAFVAATLMGTGAHLAAIPFPLPELMISVSVVAAGILLTRSEPPSAWAAVLGAIAGLFHGYAYGEAIIGAEMTPLLAYLAGFALVQLAIASGACALTQQAIAPHSRSSIAPPLKLAGLTITGAGLAFLATTALG